MDYIIDKKGIYMKEVIVFLDFDGVLHRGIKNPGDKEWFEYLSTFESCIRKARFLVDIKIVISSSWRLDFAMSFIVNLFSKDIRSHIIGYTPIVINDEKYQGSREAEAQEWLRKYNKPVQWIAIDDMPVLWNSSHRVIECRAGFRTEEEELFLSLLDY